MGVNIGEKIKALRKAHNLTQEQFGNIIHYVRTSVSNFEHNKRTPSPELLAGIADKFNVNVLYFYDDDCSQIGNDVLTVVNNKTPLDITKLTPALQIKIARIYFEFIEQSETGQKALENQIAE